MKIRSDFVTNSSSSCFCAINVTLQNGTVLSWEDEGFQDCPLFEIPRAPEKDLREIHTIEDLIQFMVKCAQVWADPEYLETDLNDLEANFMQKCKDLVASLRQAGSMDEIAALEMNWNEFMSDQGESPEDGAFGQQLTYQFSSGTYKLVPRPTEGFIADMNSLFGYDQM